ncbi:MAG TPA: sensor histidine kinase [Chloroflexi bacterium]|nr:sensor histidine kinase [Chloroflexota bacterium]
MTPTSTTNLTLWKTLAAAEATIALVLLALLLWRGRRKAMPRPLLLAFGVLVVWAGLRLVSPPLGIWRWLHGFWVPVSDRALFTLFLILTAYALVRPLFPAYRQAVYWLLGSHLGFWVLLTAAALYDFSRVWQPRARFTAHWSNLVFGLYQAALLLTVLMVVGYVYRHGRARSLGWAGAAFAIWLLADVLHLAAAIRGTNIPEGLGLITRGAEMLAFIFLALAYWLPDPSRRAFAERYFADAQAMVQRLEAQLAEMVAVQARLEERQRLARELHDSVSQALFSTELQLGTAEMLLENDPQAARERLEQARRTIHEAANDLRALIADLRPPALAGKTLTEALADFTHSLETVEGIPVVFEADVEGRLSEAEEAELYRIAYEALTNAVRHGQPHQINVSLWLRPPAFRLAIADDGQGFDPTHTPSGHWGLVGMRERAERLGASLAIDSAPGRGTRVEIVRASPAADFASVAAAPNDLTARSNRGSFGSTS